MCPPRRGRVGRSPQAHRRSGRSHVHRLWPGGARGVDVVGGLVPAQEQDQEEEREHEEEQGQKEDQEQEQEQDAGVGAREAG